MTATSLEFLGICQSLILHGKLEEFKAWGLMSWMETNSECQSEELGLVLYPIIKKALECDDFNTDIEEKVRLLIENAVSRVAV